MPLPSSFVCQAVGIGFFIDEEIAFAMTQICKSDFANGELPGRNGLMLSLIAHSGSIVFKTLAQ